MEIGIVLMSDVPSFRDNKISGKERLGCDPVAIGFRAKKANGKYRYFWLYRVIFGIPATNLTTKGEILQLRFFHP